MNDVTELKAEITRLNEVLRRKNRMLDALKYVWCSGGCHGGVNRYSGERLTEDLVRLAEANTLRLRGWLINSPNGYGRHYTPIGDQVESAETTIMGVKNVIKRLRDWPDYKMEGRLWETGFYKALSLVEDACSKAKYEGC